VVGGAALVTVAAAVALVTNGGDERLGAEAGIPSTSAGGVPAGSASPWVMPTVVEKQGPLKPVQQGPPGERSQLPDKLESRACTAAAPGPGVELMTLPHAALPGNNKINHHWWGSNGKIRFNAYDGTSFDANVDEGSEQNSDLIILHSCVPTIKGERYELDFRMAANPSVPVLLRVQDSLPSLTEIYTDTLRPTPTREPKRIRFTATKSTRAGELTFQVGGQPGGFRLAVTDVSLRRL
jgi:hypothetical protein